MRVSELMAALAKHYPADPEVFHGPYALLSVNQADPDNGRLYVTISNIMSPPPSLLAETEQQAEPLTLEQRVEALTRSVEALETRLSEDTCYNLAQIADALDYDTLAREAARHVNLRELARWMDFDLECIAETLADRIDSSDIAEHFDASDIADNIDLSDLAGYIDTEDVAEHLDMTDTVRAVLTTTRFRLDT